MSEVVERGKKIQLLGQICKFEDIFFFFFSFKIFFFSFYLCSLKNSSFKRKTIMYLSIISYEVISSASFKSDYRLCVDFIHIETFSSLFHLLFLYSFLLYFVVVVDTKLI